MPEPGLFAEKSAGMAVVWVAAAAAAAAVVVL